MNSGTPYKQQLGIWSQALIAIIRPSKRVGRRYAQVRILIIDHACTMIRIHPWSMNIARAWAMITIRACTLIIVHASATIITLT